MAKQPDKEPDPKEAERRFNETLERLVNTPHKPHIKKSETDSVKTAKATPGVKSRRRPAAG
jgi:hypothetical protein